MSYLALYRKWRPLVFEEIIDQEHIATTLRNSVKMGRISHAYLFTGTRGTGKTSTAHILSRAINCLDPIDGDPCNVCEICRGIIEGNILDVLEIDAASNNSIDNIREIRDEVVYLPSQAKYKVYIIDEVHMLSTGAFNALLKTLEEPPEQVVFILATTEPHKVPQTIISRCQRHDFRKISAEGIMRQLVRIAASNDMTVDDDALRLIARLSEGSMRDALGLLDQCISIRTTETGAIPGSVTATASAAVAAADVVATSAAVDAVATAYTGDAAAVSDAVATADTGDAGDAGASENAVSIAGATVRITYDDVIMLVGTVNEDTIRELVDHIIAANVEKAIIRLNAAVEEGKDIARLVSDIIGYYRNMLISISIGDPGESMTGLMPAAYDSLKVQGNALGYQEVIMSIKELSLLESNLKWMPNPKVMLEVAVIKLCGRLYSMENESMLDKIALLERRIETLATALNAASRQPVEQGQYIGPDRPASQDQRKPAYSPANDANRYSPVAASAAGDQAKVPVRDTIKDQANDAALSQTKNPARKPDAASTSAGANRFANKELLFWDEILHDLRNSDKKMLHANLEGTSAFELDINNIGIAFKSGSSLKKIIAMKPANSAILEEAIQKKLGRQIHIKCVDESNFPLANINNIDARSKSTYTPTYTPTARPSEPEMKTPLPSDIEQQSAKNANNKVNSGDNRGRYGDNDAEGIMSSANGNDDDSDGGSDFVQKALKFAKKIDIPYNNE